MAAVLKSAFSPAAFQATNGRSRSVRVMAANFPDKAPPGKGKLQASGYIVDNSSKGNVFPTTSKPYIESKRSEAVANDGPLGGLSGGVILLGVVAAVGVVAFGALQAPPADTLQSVGTTLDGDALSAIAGRIAKSL